MIRIAKNLTLPPEAVTETFAILAKRGVGKTYTASVMTEELIKAGLPVVVIDPIGVWWGLRSSASGKEPGLPVTILGGDHADVPLESTAGELIADLVIDKKVPFVLDLSHFRKAEQVRFMTDFAERLYHKNREPLHILMDEADAFAPQRPMKGAERCLGAIEDLVRRGRARGIGMTLVTQRAAVLNKNVLTQIEVLIALRTISPQDRNAIDEWIKVHGSEEERRQLMESLPSLPVGTAWFWSPGWLDIFKRIEVRKKDTYDSSSTPKAGRSPVRPTKFAEVNLEELGEAIQATVERKKAEDPKELSREIARLKKEINNAPKVKTETVEVPVLDKEIVKAVGDVMQRVIDVVKPIMAALEEAGIKYDKNRKAFSYQGRELSPSKDKIEVIPKKSGVRVVSREEGGSLRAGEERMLRTLAERYPLRFTRAQLGTLSKFAPRGGTFQQYFGSLKRRGFIEEVSGEISITELGFDYLGIIPPAAPKTSEETIELWRGVLRAGERKMFDVLVDIYPEVLNREELGEQTGFTASGGTFQQYLGSLRRNNLIEVSGSDIKASDELF